jgi:Bacterial regulatory protein, Fis family
MEVRPRSRTGPGKTGRPGLLGGHGKRDHGGTVNPPRNRKGGTGNPPPPSRRARDLSQQSSIATVLRENNGNQSKAARELGMRRNTLTRTASALRLDVHALRPGSRRLPRSERLVTVAKRVSR